MLLERTKHETRLKENIQSKIVSFEELNLKLKYREKKVVVHCHGVFDLLHIGHIKHFQQAKKLGDIVVVTLTPDRYVNKGPNRPCFTEKLRAEAIAALDVVALGLAQVADEGVGVTEHPGLADAGQALVGVDLHVGEVPPWSADHVRTDCGDAHDSCPLRRRIRPV